MNLQSRDFRVSDNSRRTLAEELRLQVADEIVHGVPAPGTALDETELATRFRVSRTPVREAIRQLAASGLVETRARRAAVVARPSTDCLAGMFEATGEIEALCAGLAAERMSAVERRELEGLHEQLREPIQVGDPQRHHEIDEAFHGAIYAGAHNAYLADFAIATRARVERLGLLAQCDEGSAGPVRGDEVICGLAHRRHREQKSDLIFEAAARGKRGANPMSCGCCCVNPAIGAAWQSCTGDQRRACRADSSSLSTSASLRRGRA